MQQDDLLAVVYDSQEGRTGGYVPISFLVQNRGPDAQVTVVFRERSGTSFNVSKSFILPQNAEQKIQLLVPIIVGRLYGELSFYRNGKYLKEMTFDQSLYSGSRPPYYYGSSSGTSLKEPPLLVEISNAVPDQSSYIQFLDDNHYSSDIGQPRIEPTMAPVSWLGYTALDIVSISLAELEKLDGQQRTALLEWVRCGGNLIVHSLGEGGAESGSLDKLLDLQQAAAATEWLSLEELYANPERRLPGQPTQNYAAGKLQKENDKLAIRCVMLGRLLAITDSPFQWASGKWGGIYNAIGGNNLSWQERHGVEPTSKSESFLEFLIPGIRRVPAWGFITLVSIFVVLIGPVSLFVLGRTRRRTHLLWAVPAVSLLTCGLLFTYSTFANGFSTKSRLRSLTILDQRNQSAVSYTRLALFTPAGSTSLRFDPSTAVFPIRAEDRVFSGGSVDWTEVQELQGGYHRANEQSQLELLQPRTERGHLEFGEIDNEQLPVTNGLEWGLKQLLVRGPDDQLYWCENLSAGAKATLARATGEDTVKILQTIAAQSLHAPDVGAPPNYGYRSYYYGGYTTPTVRIGAGQMERYLSRLRVNTALALSPNSYAAIVDGPPSLDLGIQRHSVREQLNVLVGFY